VTIIFSVLLTTLYTFYRVKKERIEKYINYTLEKIGKEKVVAYLKALAEE
jgi:hypothetical protein